MAKEKCTFCKNYDREREAEKFYKDPRFQARYYAELVTTLYSKEAKRECGRVASGKVRLHYCPYCGKKLR